MRDIVPKVSEDRASHEQRKISARQYINHFEVRDVSAMKKSYDVDEDSVSSQDSGTSSTISGKSDVPTYRSYRKYLDGYDTLKFKPVRPAPEAEASYKAEIVIQVRAADKQCAAAPPPPPPAMPRAPCSDPKARLLDELKAKHPPKEYQCHHQEASASTRTRRTSAPIYTPPSHQPIRVMVLGQQPTAPPPPQLLPKPPANTLQRRWSARPIHSTMPTMLANPDAQTVTRVPAARPDASVNRNDPNVKKLVYATLRNYVGAYNNRANQMAAQHGNVVQDKGVTAQIKSITESGNLSHLNGRINPKENE